jgi:hypothetical protein
MLGSDHWFMVRRRGNLHGLLVDPNGCGASRASLEGSV